MQRDISGIPLIFFDKLYMLIAMMLDWYELSHIYTPKCKELVKKQKEVGWRKIGIRRQAFILIIKGDR